MDIAAGKAVLIRSDGILIFAQTRTETKEWALCLIPVAVEGGREWTTQKPWTATVRGEWLDISPSVLDRGDAFKPEWHNTAQWTIEFIDYVPSADPNEWGFGLCKTINANLFAGWTYVGAE